jgi:hypothetical protein
MALALKTNHFRNASKTEVAQPERHVGSALDCVAKLPLMRIAKHDSVGGNGIGGSGG